MNFGIEIPFQTLVTVSLVTGGYFAFITVFGLIFSRFSSDINDFFFSGQRLAWPLPFMSMMATGVGSYSYLKYSQQGWNTGMSGSLGYMNEWFILPLFFFGWLPIVYFSKVKSVPEYFEKRFNRLSRYVAVLILLAYIFYYIGYNLFTVGLAFQGLFGLSPLITLPVVIGLLGLYVTLGGQTAVIFTDLVQGLLLYIAGFAAIGCGLYVLGGLEEFWSYLPPSHRNPFPPFRANPRFNSAGLFWGDALFASTAFVFINQGFLMRFLSIRSLNEARTAGVCNVFITLPLSAVTVGAIGWIGKAIVMKQQAGFLPGHELLEISDSYHTFVTVVWNLVQNSPWIFGLILSALLAALMSTTDTLINAASAVGIYDIYKPLVRPTASDRHYLRAARLFSLLSALIGLVLAAWFFGWKGTLMTIHYKGIMMIIPSLLTVLIMGILWKRFNGAGASAALIAGALVSFMTVFFPEWIYPLRNFALGSEASDPLYFRAVFGVLVSAGVGVFAALLTKAPPESRIKGWTADTVKEAARKFKGGREPDFAAGKTVRGLRLTTDESLKKGWIALSSETADLLNAEEGDLVYAADSRFWLAGLRSGHFHLTLNKQKNAEAGSGAEKPRAFSAGDETERDGPTRVFPSETFAGGKEARLHPDSCEKARLILKRSLFVKKII